MNSITDFNFSFLYLMTSLILTLFPGTGYLYTTHGWTVVSGVVEGAAGKPFTKVIAQLFHELGLENTYLDVNTPIIYNRAR